MSGAKRWQSVWVFAFVHVAPYEEVTLYAEMTSFRGGSVSTVLMPEADQSQNRINLLILCLCTKEPHIDLGIP